MSDKTPDFIDVRDLRIHADTPLDTLLQWQPLINAQYAALGNWQRHIDQSITDLDEMKPLMAERTYQCTLEGAAAVAQWKITYSVYFHERQALAAMRDDLVDVAHALLVKKMDCESKIAAYGYKAQNEQARLAQEKADAARQRDEKQAAYETHKHRLYRQGKDISGMPDTFEEYDAQQAALKAAEEQAQRDNRAAQERQIAEEQAARAARVNDWFTRGQRSN